MSEPHPAGRTNLACAGAIFLGAFLLFQVQPIVAKAILPRYGGAPAVWTTCMLFFQTLLLGGYAYAHAVASRLKPRVQSVVHVVLLAGALSTLPISPKPGETAGAAEAPILEILLLLLRAVAAPYVLLASTSPLLQSWSAAGGGGSPYRLYALSNVGSMLALLSYPVAVEPWLTTRQQETVWSVAFGVFALLSVLAVPLAWNPSSAAAQAGPAPAPDAPPPSLGRRLMWLALPACASILLLAVTNQMCQEVAVVPFLWLIPLSLYLLSFILPFESDRWYSRSWCVPVMALVLVVLTSAAAMGARAGILYGVPVYSAGLFVCCLFCHGELAARRPAPRYLTSYYLLMSLGGALGGVFVSLIAPFLFRGFDEIYVGLALCGALAAGVSIADPSNIIAGRRMWNPMHLWIVGVAGVALFVLVLRIYVRTQPGVRELRDFYGTIRVVDLPSTDHGPIRFLTHVGTRHGQQFMDPERRRIPTSYFTRRCGIGKLLEELSNQPPRRMAIIGLGAGILASYGRPGDLIRYYELSPRMIEVARRDFTFLSDSKAKTEVVPGDARLSLERETGQPPYDILVGDAFSSDAIPAHLLTKEAFQLYASRLKPGGVLALNVSTRHLDLGPLVTGLAATIGRSAVEIDTAEDDEGQPLNARWILITSDAALLERLRTKAGAIDPSSGRTPPRLWTDDYSNLLQVLKR